MSARTLSAEIRRRMARTPQVRLPVARGVRPGQEQLFPPAAHLLNAESHAARAAMLVRLSDALVVTHGPVLEQACRGAGFATGAQFLQVRLAALLSRRDAAGALPVAPAGQLGFWTDFMTALAREER